MKVNDIGSQHTHYMFCRPSCCLVCCPAWSTRIMFHPMFPGEHGVEHCQKERLNITKPKFSKWPLLRFVEVTDKEISEIKLNSVPKK